MKHHISHLHLSAVLLAVIMPAACNTDNDVVPAGDHMPLALTTTIAGAPSAPATRAVRYPTHDLWSTSAFAIGDELGFFSRTGGGTNGNEALANIKLTAESTLDSGGGAKFRAQDGTNFDTEKLTAENVHFYFPYDENITGTGLELRVEDNKDNDGIKRCIDFLVDLSVDPKLLKENELSGIIRHTFGELIITRGAGFEKWRNLPKEKQKITVVMKDPVTHVKINYTANPWTWEPSLEYYESAKENCADGDARRWEAWKGAPYGQTVGNDGNIETEGKDAWYVIVPTLKGKPSVVEYIEIYDNEGMLQKITALRLDNEDDSDIYDENRKHQDRDGNSVWATWRYPMEIAMKELVPTVNPFPIVPWDQTDNDITNKRAPGITNQTEYGEWVGLYNNYITSHRPESSDERLKTYGDLEQEGDKKVWHFYISTGIEFDRNGNPQIEELQDILDGTSSTIGDGYTFSNNVLTNITNTFVNKLSVNGCLRNINFKSPAVTVSDATVAGILANAIEGGTVTNCNISSGALIGNTNTTVGIVSGSITGGTVENCTLSGLIIGKDSDATSGYMFGQKSGNPMLTNNNSTNVTFSDINKTDDEL